MESPAVTLLLIGIFLLALVNTSRAECCFTKEEITYRMEQGECRDVGGNGKSRNECTITICADGFAKVGTYCGQSSCNIFGCNCDGGCLEGDWSKSFLEKHSDYEIEILDVTRYF